MATALLSLSKSCMKYIFLALPNWTLMWMGILSYVVQSGQVTILQSHHISASSIPFVLVLSLPTWFQRALTTLSQHLQLFF